MKGRAAFIAGAVLFAALQLLWSVGHVHSPRNMRAGRLWLGGMASLVVALVVVGPGNLWPIVMVFDGAILFGAIILGAAIGAELGRTPPDSEGGPG